jgi:hypothetical protein
MKSRALGSYEKAAARTHVQAPFHAAVAAEFDGALDAVALREGLARAMASAPLAAMVPRGSYFDACDAAEPEFIIETGDASALLAAAIDQLLSDRPEQRGAHPVRVRLVQGHATSALALCAPHYLVDAVALGHLLFAMLGAPCEPQSEAPAPIEDRFPAAYRGLRAWPKLAGFMATQMGDEAKLRSRGGAAAPAPALGPTRHIVQNFDASFAGALSAACRSQRSTPSGIIGACAAQVFVREILKLPAAPVGVMSFRDLRRRVRPQPGEQDVEVAIAMVRHVVSIATSETDWATAQRLSEAIAASGRKGEAYAANLVAPSMVSGAFAIGMRFADVAVSYPVLRWPRLDVLSRLRAFSGYVSAMPPAPPLSIIAAPSPVGVSLSFMYSAAERSEAEMTTLVQAVSERLRAAVAGAAA